MRNMLRQLLRRSQKAVDAEGDATALIYVGYAALMRDLRLMELHLWAIQALSIKANSTDAQAFAKVEKWDGTTLAPWSAA
jgi:hypothetical protein